MTSDEKTEAKWPAEELRAQLTAINSDYLRNSLNPILRDRDSWPNQQPELFSEELADALKHSVVPLSPGDQSFLTLIRSGKRFNWAVLLDGTLRVTLSIVSTDDGPTRISHAILSKDGGAVLAAGEGRFEDYLSSTTGHYKNDPIVLSPVKHAFTMIGITFKR